MINTNRIRHLLKKSPLTARQIAAVLGISKPTAYALINRMRDAGFPIYEIHEKRKGPGPVATAYGIK